MGDKDLVATINQPRESGSSTIKYPMLTTTNYTVCSMHMKVAPKVHKVWETIEPGVDDGDKNDMARALLFQSIIEALILQVGNLDTQRKYGNQSKQDMWELIEF